MTAAIERLEDDLVEGLPAQPRRVEAIFGIFVIEMASSGIKRKRHMDLRERYPVCPAVYAPDGNDTLSHEALSSAKSEAILR